MNQTNAVVLFVGLAALLAVAVTAPSTAVAQTNTAPTTDMTVPAGSVQRTENAWRGRTLTGAPVFDDNRQRIATINELLINDDGTVAKVVISITRPRRLVAIAFNQLRFVPSASTAMPIAWRGHGHMHRLNNTIDTYGVLLPGTTLEALAQMETFHFVATQ